MTITKQSKLQDLFDNAAANAKRMFDETGEVLAMWHAVNGKNENILIATPWGDEDEKDATVDALRHLFRAQHVKRFAFIVEAWVRQAVSMEDINSCPPSEHPDRREILMITAEDRDGSQIMGFYYILRPEHGPAKLSPLHVQPYDATAGRMVGLLD
jgi:hypothetical protein